MRSLASPVRVKWFAALAVGGVSQTEEKVVFKEAHDRALVSSWGAALGPLCLIWHHIGVHVTISSPRPLAGDALHWQGRDPEAG